MAKRNIRLKIRVIRKLAKEGKEMHYRDITNALIKQGVIINGKTPWLTVNSLLSRAQF